MLTRPTYTLRRPPHNPSHNPLRAQPHQKHRALSSSERSGRGAFTASPLTPIASTAFDRISNEAFASQAEYTRRYVGIPKEKLNPVGGAIALGHPLGATGSRQVATRYTKATHLLQLLVSRAGQPGSM